MAAPTWLRNAVLDHIRNSSAMPTMPANLYLALCTSAGPTDSAQGTEILSPGAGGYARQAITYGAPSSGGGFSQMANASDLTFGVFSSDPAQAETYMVVDHLTATAVTNMWDYGTLNVARNAAIGQTIKVPAGSLILKQQNI